MGVMTHVTRRGASDIWRRRIPKRALCGCAHALSTKDGKAIVFLRSPWLPHVGLECRAVAPAWASVLARLPTRSVSLLLRGQPVYPAYPDFPNDP